MLDDDYVRPYEAKPGMYVRLSITDTGTGMDKATKERVFDPFFTTKERGRGTGLGLASAYGIIKHHSGIINLYSEKGHGTTFNIYLPVSTSSAGRIAMVADDNKVKKGVGTILIVDDEDMIIDVGSGMLESFGYKVLKAKSGKEALELYKDKGDTIDLVLLDMIMPGLGGSETFDGLKKINPGIKVILSSGYSSNEKTEGILRRGCNGFIQKPFNMKILSQKISKVLSQ